jgi:hypothetical protein
MNLFAGARWLLTLGSRRANRRRGSDPADMGTAFGLDAITTTPRADSPRRIAAARRRRPALALRAAPAPALDALAVAPAPRAARALTLQDQPRLVPFGLAAPLVAAALQTTRVEPPPGAPLVVVRQCRWPWIHRSARGIRSSSALQKLAVPLRSP